MGPLNLLLFEQTPDAQASRGKLVRYEDDAFTWALQQAELLRTGRIDGLDRINLADEIADVARREYDKLESALARVLQHILKWDYQPARRGRSWVLSIERHRALVNHQLDDHPGLKSMLEQAMFRGYERARLDALKETGLPRSTLPDAVPYGWSEIMQREITWPED